MTKNNFMTLLSTLRSGGAKVFTLTVNGNAINLTVDGEAHADRIYCGANVAKQHDTLVRWLGVWMYENPIPVIANSEVEDAAIMAATPPADNVVTVGFRYYRFDVSNEDESDYYQQMCVDMREQNGGSYINRQTLGSWSPSKEARAFNMALFQYGSTHNTIQIDTSHLFDGQFNTPKGVITENGIRAFLWAEYDYPNTDIKEGYFLIDSCNTLKKLLASTYGCGFCGVQYDAAQALELDYACPSCIASRYLTLDNLNLLHLLPLNAPRNTVRRFSPEKFKLMADRMTAAKWEVQSAVEARYFPETRKAETDIHNAKVAKMEKELNAKLWLLDNGIKINDFIFYHHTGRGCFGWHGDGVDQQAADKLKTLLVNCPFEYDIKIRGNK